MNEPLEVFIDEAADFEFDHSISLYRARRVRHLCLSKPCTARLRKPWSGVLEANSVIVFRWGEMTTNTGWVIVQSWMGGTPIWTGHP